MNDEIRTATLKVIDGMANRLAGTLDADLIASVKLAAVNLSGRTDLDFRPKSNTSASIATKAQALLLDQLLADGLSDEAIDPVRDAMDDLYA
jgi:hypothetical protein